jgi:hypothetical protein
MPKSSAVWATRIRRTEAPEFGTARSLPTIPLSPLPAFKRASCAAKRVSRAAEIVAREAGRDYNKRVGDLIHHLL